MGDEWLGMTQDGLIVHKRPSADGTVFADGLPAERCHRVTALNMCPVRRGEERALGVYVADELPVLILSPAMARGLVDLVTEALDEMDGPPTAPA